jgi:hypothetical protein
MRQWCWTSERGPCPGREIPFDRILKSCAALTLINREPRDLCPPDSFERRETKMTEQVFRNGVNVTQLSNTIDQITYNPEVATYSFSTTINRSVPINVELQKKPGS